MKEYIAHAAIRQDGKLYVGHRHHRIIQDIVELTGKRLGAESEQGFTTSERRFVDRQTAREIAIEAGQIDGRAHPKMLFSEDIWPSIEFKEDENATGRPTKD